LAGRRLEKNSSEREKQTGDAKAHVSSAQPLFLFVRLFLISQNRGRQMQTVAEYYNLLDPCEGIGNLEILCYGHFPDSAISQLEKWGRWRALFQECYAVIEELREQPFRGAPTCLIVMDMAQKRFRKKHGGTVPSIWFWTMARLKEQPEETK
jgi:hypothetical protein